MASVYILLAAAERAELLAAELYGMLAERFASKEVLRVFFGKLHAEEIQHATRVRLLAAQYRNDPGLFSGAAMFEGAPDPRQVLAELEAIVREVEAGAWGSDLREVKTRIVELEKRCVSVHTQFMVAGAPRAISSFFEELAKQDEEHERLLADL
jgi:rubrerythrin